MDKKVIIVAGPTASGKSALGLEIAAQTNGVIVNCDSMQIYRELPILTAQPSAEEQGDIAHRLYGVLKGAEACSVGRWRDLAVVEIEQILSQGKQPIVLGGTGLYVKALMEGLSKIPDVSRQFRLEATELYDQIGPDGLVKRIADTCTQTADQLKTNDRQRIIRAWEVFLATGKSLSTWQREHPPFASEGYSFQTVLVSPSRDELYERCDKRFLSMIDQGAMEEVSALLALDLDPDLPVMRAIGVPEIKAYLDGMLSKEEMIASAQQATRRYAKRQLTWLRNQIDCEIKLQSPDEIESFIAKIR